MGIVDDHALSGLLTNRENDPGKGYDKPDKPTCIYYQLLYLEFISQ